MKLSEKFSAKVVTANEYFAKYAKKQEDLLKKLKEKKIGKHKWHVENQKLSYCISYAQNKVAKLQKAIERAEKKMRNLGIDLNEQISEEEVKETEEKADVL